MATESRASKQQGNREDAKKPSGEPTTPSDSDKFLSFNYQELKDLGKHFLTIVSGVVAISITFSEKMIDFTKATGLQKSLLIGSWSCLIVAVVTAGIGIYVNYVAGAHANGSIIKGSRTDFKSLVKITYVLYHVGGVCFVIGLCLMAAMSVLKFW